MTLYKANQMLEEKYITRRRKKKYSFRYFQSNTGSKRKYVMLRTIGSGSVKNHIRFWHDLWCGDRPLKLCFSTLYTIARSPDAWVVDNLSMVGGVTHWNVLFTRNAQDWELEMVMSFFEQLYSTRVRHGEVDRAVWILSKRRNFEVKTFYKTLV